MGIFSAVHLGKPAEGDVFTLGSRTKAAGGNIEFGKGLMKGAEADVVLQFDGTTGKIFAGLAGYSDEATVYGPAANTSPTGLSNYPVSYKEGDIVRAYDNAPILVAVDASSSGVLEGQDVALMPSGDFDTAITAAGTSGTFALNLRAKFLEDGDAGDVVAIELYNLMAVEIQV